MTRVRVLLAALMFAVVITAGTRGDDKPKRLKGQLPPNWGKLGLSDEQKQKVYAAQDEFRPKIAELEAKIKELRRQQREAMENVLSDAQKARLKELLLQKAPGEKKKSTSIKP